MGPSSTSTISPSSRCDKMCCPMKPKRSVMLLLTATTYFSVMKLTKASFDNDSAPGARSLRNSRLAPASVNLATLTGSQISSSWAWWPCWAPSASFFSAAAAFVASFFSFSGFSPSFSASPPSSAASASAAAASAASASAASASRSSSAGLATSACLDGTILGLATGFVGVGFALATVFLIVLILTSLSAFSRKVAKSSSSITPSLSISTSLKKSSADRPCCCWAYRRTDSTALWTSFRSWTSLRAASSLKRSTRFSARLMRGVNRRVCISILLAKASCL
mmetsp:Transcript_103554/g.203031  ORF Transcript_103554/g.203031 Transcript_103554/m.203031 type:complete len:280 (-) Transcript_103554:746-1585(-)